MIRVGIIAAASAAVLTLSPVVSAQQAKYGTAAEAKAMLEKAVLAVKANKARALEMFNKGEGGFKDRDLQPFCFNKGDGKIVATIAPRLLGTDVRTLKDKTGEVFGEEIFKAGIDGKITEVRYMFPRPGETKPRQKISFITGVDDVGCGVGYYP
ncbi:MAG: chemotaxis protein [Gammaproteobacteria bacterium]|nr:chemotaxis protein [Gammaproteobacteria bacterium]NIP87885.1 chemotaxis protein [Gammaproteobacteria bacterium]NIR22439.1 chemotaxis protein [Gammaproteobacteria bacterium]NIS04011.1 chemotaxis protein [Gammaproteobacteria bacterium]NIV45953.1 chemotaxis protein [Gammaproteobacteria bacterium]